MTITTADPGTQAPAYATDPNGFPVIDCTRCSGSGRYPSSRHDGVCLACNGTQHVHPRGTVGRLAGQWAELVKEASRADTSARRNVATGEIVCDVQAGDVITSPWATGDDWLTVDRVEITDEVIGQSKIGGQVVGETLRVLIHFTTGKSWPGGWTARRNVDHLDGIRADLVDRARIAYDRTLAHRAAKAQAS